MYEQCPRIRRNNTIDKDWRKRRRRRTPQQQAPSLFGRHRQHCSTLRILCVICNIRYITIIVLLTRRASEVASFIRHKQRQQRQQQHVIQYHFLRHHHHHPLRLLWLYPFDPNRPKEQQQQNPQENSFRSTTTTRWEVPWQKSIPYDKIGSSCCTLQLPVHRFCTSTCIVLFVLFNTYYYYYPHHHDYYYYIDDSNTVATVANAAEIVQEQQQQQVLLPWTKMQNSRSYKNYNSKKNNDMYRTWTFDTSSSNNNKNNDDENTISDNKVVTLPETMYLKATTTTSSTTTTTTTKPVPLVLQHPKLLGFGAGGAVFSMERHSSSSHTTTNVQQHKQQTEQSSSSSSSLVAVKVSWTRSTMSVHNECTILQSIQQQQQMSTTTTMNNVVVDDVPSPSLKDDLDIGDTDNDDNNDRTSVLLEQVSIPKLSTIEECLLEVPYPYNNNHNHKTNYPNNNNSNNKGDRIMIVLQPVITDPTVASIQDLLLIPTTTTTTTTSDSTSTTMVHSDTTIHNNNNNNNNNKVIVAVTDVLHTMIQLLFQYHIVTVDVQPLISQLTGHVVFIDFTEASNIGVQTTTTTTSDDNIDRVDMDVTQLQQQHYERNHNMYRYSERDIILTRNFINEMMLLIPTNVQETIASTILVQELEQIPFLIQYESSIDILQILLEQNISVSSSKYIEHLIQQIQQGHQKSS